MQYKTVNTDVDARMREYTLHII